MPNPSFTRAAAVVLASLGCFAKQCVADEIIVRLDQPVYVVSGPGDVVTAQVLIDGNADRQGLQPVSDGLFSAGLKILFDDRKATVDSKANVIVKRELDYFGFSAPALVSTTPSGEVSIHGNISQADVPLKIYQGSVLGSVRMTNRATAVDRYPLELDFSRDLGPNEDFFVDGKGITRDASIRFIPSEVVVAEAPAQGDLDGDGTVGWISGDEVHVGWQIPQTGRLCRSGDNAAKRRSNTIIDLGNLALLTEMIGYRDEITDKVVPIVVTRYFPCFRITVTTSVQGEDVKLLNQLPGNKVPGTPTETVGVM